MNHRNILALTAVIIGYFLLSTAFFGMTPIESAEGQNSLTRAERNWEYINHNKGHKTVSTTPLTHPTTRSV